MMACDFCVVAQSTVRWRVGRFPPIAGLGRCRNRPLLRVQWAAFRLQQLL
jgi:hypothetical protein